MKNILRKIIIILKIIIGKEIYFPIQIKIEKVFLGSKKYGGWVINPNRLNKKSIVYSFGIGEDISFDRALISRFGCKILAFDPTPKSISWLKKQNLPKNFNYFKYGLAAKNGFIKLYPPQNPKHVSYSIINKNKKTNSIKAKVKNLNSIMENFGHQKIDLLKMDIEGSEYEVIDNITDNNFNIDQILIEFHHRFPTIKIDKTKKAIKKLNKVGYKIFHISPSREEYSFIADRK
jgi:FkbM family methyltransferase